MGEGYSKIREAVERLRAEVDFLTSEATNTVNEFKRLVRDLSPKPIRRAIRSRVDRLLGRERRRGE